MITPLRMPSPLPHDLCHGRSSSRWLPAEGFYLKMFLIKFFTLVVKKQVVVFQSLGHVRIFVTPWTAARQASLSFTISRSLLKLMCHTTISVVPFSCLQSTREDTFNLILNISIRSFLLLLKTRREAVWSLLINFCILV